MPKMDGLEATRRFRAWEQSCRTAPQGQQHAATRKRLPIVALSANVVDEKIEECTAAGMDGFLGKPLRLDALRSVMAENGLTLSAR